MSLHRRARLVTVLAAATAIVAVAGMTPASAVPPNPLRGVAAVQARQAAAAAAASSQRGSASPSASAQDEPGGEEGEGDSLEVADQAEQYANERSAPARLGFGRSAAGRTPTGKRAAGVIGDRQRGDEATRSTPSRPATTTRSGRTPAPVSVTCPAAPPRSPSTGRTYYLGTADGGVWKSTDAGTDLGIDLGRPGDAVDRRAARRQRPLAVGRHRRGEHQLRFLSRHRGLPVHRTTARRSARVGGTELRRPHHVPACATTASGTSTPRPTPGSVSALGRHLELGAGSCVLKPDPNPTDSPYDTSFITDVASQARHRTARPCSRCSAGAAARRTTASTCRPPAAAPARSTRSPRPATSTRTTSAVPRLRTPPTARGCTRSCSPRPCCNAEQGHRTCRACSSPRTAIRPGRTRRSPDSDSRSATPVPHCRTSPATTSASSPGTTRRSRWTRRTRGTSTSAWKRFSRLETAGTTFTTASPYWNYGLACGTSCPPTTHPDQHALALTAEPAGRDRQRRRRVQPADVGDRLRPLGRPQRHAAHAAVLRRRGRSHARAGRWRTGAACRTTARRCCCRTRRRTSSRPAVTAAWCWSTRTTACSARSVSTPTSRCTARPTAGTRSRRSARSAAVLRTTPTLRPVRAVHRAVPGDVTRHQPLGRGRQRGLGHASRAGPRTCATTCDWVNVHSFGTGRRGGYNVGTAVAVSGATTYAAWVDASVTRRPAFAVGIDTNYGGTLAPDPSPVLPNRFIAGLTVDPANPAHVYAIFNGYSRRWIPGGGLGTRVRVHATAAPRGTTSPATCPTHPATAWRSSTARSCSAPTSACSSRAAGSPTQWSRVDGLPNSRRRQCSAYYRPERGGCWNAWPRYLAHRCGIAGRLAVRATMGTNTRDAMTTAPIIRAPSARRRDTGSRTSSAPSRY